MRFVVTREEVYCEVVPKAFDSESKKFFRSFNASSRINFLKFGYNLNILFLTPKINTAFKKVDRTQYTYFIYKQSRNIC